MPSIPIRMSADGATWRADNTTNARLVNGNNDYQLTLTFAGEGWGEGTTGVTLTIFTEGGTQLTRNFLIEDFTPEITVNILAMTDAYLVRVHIRQHARRTTTPALIFCDECVTDDSGSAETPRADVYNLMTEYLRQKEQGAQEAAGAILTRLQELRQSAPPAFPGDAYRLAAQRSDRVTDIYGEYKVGAITRSIKTDRIVGSSLTLSTEGMATDALLPGGVPSTEMTVTLRTDEDPEYLNGAEIKMTYYIQRHDELWCEIPLGFFTVSSAEQADNGVALTAYDKMTRLDDIPRSSLSFDSGEAYTPEEIIGTIAEAADIEWDGTMPDIGYDAPPAFIVSSINESVETARDLLSWTVQLCGSIAYIDRFGALQVRKIATGSPVAEYTPHEIITARQSKLTYKLRELDTSATLTDSAGETGSSEVVRYKMRTTWNAGVTVDLSENPMWDAISGAETIADKLSAAGYGLTAITAALDPVTYEPGEVSIYGDPAIDLLDWIKVTTLSGEGEYPVTSSNWQYRGQHTLRACGQETLMGATRTQEQKAELGYREKSSADWAEAQQYMLLRIIQSAGHQGMEEYTHEWLAHFTHGELGGEET